MFDYSFVPVILYLSLGLIGISIILMLWLYIDFIKCRYFKKCAIPLETLYASTISTNLELTNSNQLLLLKCLNYIAYTQEKGVNRSYRRALKKELF